MLAPMNLRPLLRVKEIIYFVLLTSISVLFQCSHTIKIACSCFFLAETNIYKRSKIKSIIFKLHGLQLLVTNDQLVIASEFMSNTEFQKRFKFEVSKLVKKTNLSTPTNHWQTFSMWKLSQILLKVCTHYDENSKRSPA